MADPWIAPMVAGVGHASGRSIACESGSPQRRGPAHGRRGGAPGHEVRVPPPRKPPVESGVPGASKALVIVGVALQAALLIDFARPQPRAGFRAGQCRRRVKLGRPRSTLERLLPPTADIAPRWLWAAMCQ